MGVIELEPFGVFDGTVVQRFQLINTKGCRVEVISYGATLKSIAVPHDGKMDYIILGYEALEDYLVDTHYIGATVGRFANRISRASFVMDGKTYRLDRNDGENCNHGGFSGFDKKVFVCRIENEGLTMVAKSPHGEGGFPGNVTLTVIYRLTDENELFIEYRVSTDRKTPVNITNHAYFNLSGEETILNHQLKIESDSVLVFNQDFLPTGDFMDVGDNPGFNFREFNLVGNAMRMKSEAIRGYNAYFVAREGEKGLKKLATLKSDAKNRGVELFSTMPGVMVYTGDYLSGHHKPFSGMSLEAHYYPDSPNWPHFPSGYYAENDCWKETIVYRIIV